MTLAEKLRNERHKKGLEQGLHDAIELGVSIKFGDTEESKSVLAKIRTIKDINRLRTLKGRIKSAKTVPEFLAFIEN